MMSLLYIELYLALNQTYFIIKSGCPQVVELTSKSSVSCSSSHRDLTGISPISALVFTFPRFDSTISGLLLDQKFLYALNNFFNPTRTHIRSPSVSRLSQPLFHETGMLVIFTACSSLTTTGMQNILPCNEITAILATRHFLADADKRTSIFSQAITRVHAVRAGATGNA
jgi:hypothetical protein